MAVSETQDFAVTGMHPRWSYENYTWKVTGGGGTLDVKDSDPLRRIYGPEESEYDEDATIAGFTVQYTAPDVNPYCELNPTIELWCGGNLMASLKIAINASAEDGVAYTYKVAGAGGYPANCCEMDYRCTGVLCTTLDDGCQRTIPNIACVPYDGACDGNHCCRYVGCPGGAPMGYSDQRDAEQIQGGCCPEELL